ncbi:hypothetical protein [Streptomyces sp. NPDC017529]|uniref:hypothetical protein n=1 Tax=Streptomyces sp. NPDC017529 TaxID=3365000 RepID=UPI0037ADC672
MPQPAADDAVLKYTLKPDHLPATDTNAELELVAENLTGAPVRLSRVSLRLPRGKGAADVTEQKADGLGLRVPDDWEAYRQDLTGPDRTEVGSKDPEDVGIEVKNNGGVSFTITGLVLNGAQGQASVTACERTPAGTTRTKTLTLNKNPAGFVFRDFRPDPYMIDADHRSTSLTWKTTKPANTTVKYTLTHSTGHGPSKPIDVSGRTSYPLAPAHDTLCVLKAELTPKTGPKSTASLYTTVLVAHPAVTAGKLSAERTVNLLNRPLAQAGYLPGFTPHDWRKNLISADRPTTLTATTDSFLLVRVRTSLADKTVTATLATTKNDTTVHTATVHTGLAEQTYCLPLPAHHQLTITTSAPEIGDNEWYLLALDWRPLGAGRTALT